MNTDDLDLAHSLALLAHTHQQVQTKTASVAPTFIALGSNIHKRKNKTLKYNTVSSDQSSGRDVSLYIPGRKVWNSRGLSANTKIRISNTNVKSFTVRS